MRERYRPGFVYGCAGLFLVVTFLLLQVFRNQELGIGDWEETF
jgi:hypothetical protein